MPSPFLTPSVKTTKSELALISLGRHQIPAILNPPSAADPDGQITNSRFGSYPHATLVDIPWGSQVVASNVGARERNKGKKRKRGQLSATGAENDTAVGEDGQDDLSGFEAATSGFAHILPPTPESWTVSLPHRTQVVYTPDYSYVLQRLRARPGSKVIEAGAGSGSFSHAAARAVFNGYQNGDRTGKVFSFEYHEPRYDTLRQEIKDHGLEDIIHITHRDVYNGGFCLDSSESPKADAVFLDLPAPWEALPHLSRTSSAAGVSPLNPESSVYLCSFSPCIEQVQRTVATLRDLGWVSVGMSALQHSRLDVRRDRIGLCEEGLRGVVAAPASVEEAVGRLRVLDTKTADFIKRKKKQQIPTPNEHETRSPSENDPSARSGSGGSKQERLKSIQMAVKERKLYKEGRLVHRTEQELKTHTSYLVFAVLPRQYECAST